MIDKVNPSALVVYRNGIPVHGEEKVRALLAWRREDRSVFVPGFLPKDVDFSSLGLTKK